MCKRSCCPGDTGGGLGGLAVIAAIVVIAAIADPVIHAAETMLRAAVEIIAITLSITAVVTISTAAAIIATRLRRTRHNTVPLPSQQTPAIIWPAARVATRRHPARPEIQACPQSVSNPAGQPARGRHHIQPCAGCTEVTDPVGSADYDWRWP